MLNVFIAILVLLGFVTLVTSAISQWSKNPTLILFRMLGKRYKYEKKTHISGYPYHFSAKTIHSGWSMYGGGVLYLQNDGMVIKHPLIFRHFLPTALIPWGDMRVDKEDSSKYSVSLEISGKTKIKFYCRPKAIISIINNTAIV